jgi:hypothetical protein
MNIHEVPLANALKNEKVQSEEKICPDHPPDLFPLHTLIACIAPRGSGKTNAVALMAKRYMDFGSFTKIYMLSPTYESNSAWDTLEVEADNLWTDANDMRGAIGSIIEKQGQDVEEYENYLAYKEAYQRWKRGKHTFQDEVILEHNDYKKPPHVPRPSPLVILDDLSHTDIYSTSRGNPFNNFCLRHRHIGGRHYGISVFMLVQNFKTGIPKFLRQNIQQYLIWPTHDMDMLEGLYKEFANLCTEDAFLNIYHKAVEGEHNFLTIDPNNPDKAKRFRRNFDTLLIVPENEQPYRWLSGSKRGSGDVEDVEGVSRGNKTKRKG